MRQWKKNLKKNKFGHRNGFPKLNCPPKQLPASQKLQEIFLFLKFLKILPHLEKSLHASMEKNIEFIIF